MEIRLTNAFNTIIYANTFINNQNGIGEHQTEHSQNSIITANTFMNNDCALIVGSNSTINSNIFDANQGALSFSGCSDSQIYKNTFSNNQAVLIFSNASSNTIYLNNFINNQRSIIDNGINMTSTYFLPPPPSINQFDNGTYGNYGSEYQGADANGDGIGDSAYRVYENNIDNYPLPKPTLIPTVADSH